MRTQQEELPRVKELVGSLIATTLGGLLLTFSSYLVYKIYKLVKFEDLPMLLSIISITLSLICLIAFQVWAIIGDFQDEQGYFNSNIADCIANIFDTLKLIFLFFAFTFDLYKWCIFIAATSTVQNKELLDSRTKKLTIALIATQISIFLIFTAFIIGVFLQGNPSDKPSEDYKKWLHYEHNFNMGIFFLFLILYICTLIMLTKRLKKLYPSFFQKERK